MRNCQFSFQKMTARCEDIFSLQIIFISPAFPLPPPHPTSPACKNALICRSYSVAELFCNAMPSFFQMKSCNFAPAKHIYPIKCKHSTLFFFCFSQTYSWLSLGTATSNYNKRERVPIGRWLQSSCSLGASPSLNIAAKYLPTASASSTTVVRFRSYSLRWFRKWCRWLSSP